jgi:beta-phosphoglucomutase
MLQHMRGAIFDLDGVLVDTAKFHYLAWKRTAAGLGFDFTEKDNERLKGVSRDNALGILLQIGGVILPDNEKPRLAAQKNEWYVDYIRQINASEILPGVVEYIQSIRARGVKTAIGSASRNTGLILDRLGIQPMFDVVVDGNKVSQAKPDPEVFLRASRELSILPADCVVFEDAEAGVQAALAAGMGVVGIGNPADLSRADLVIRGFWQLPILLG